MAHRAKSSFHSRSPRVTWPTIAGVALALGAFGWAARSREVERAEGPGVLPLVVPTASVTWKDHYTVTRSFVGRVEARQDSALGFEISGMVEAVLVEEGEVVASGDVVARLDSARLRARRAELAAEVEQARSDAELAQLTLDRLTEAREREAASIQEWDEADKARDAALARQRRAEAALDSIDVDLDKTVIRAPFDAFVAERSIDTGRVIDAGTPVVRLLERDRPEVRFGLGGSAIDAVFLGQEFSMRIRDREVRGVVTRLLPTRDRASRSVDVIVELDAELDGIRAGDLARIDIERQVDERGFWAPIRALTEGVRGLWTIYVLSEDKSPTLLRADVEILHTQLDRVFVRGALRDGDRFVGDGLHRVAPGMRVRVAEDAPAPAIARREGRSP